MIPFRGQTMRLIPFMLALLLAGPAMAASEDWKEYEYPDYSFTVHFPADPKIETTTYEASGGRSFEARIYSAAQDTGAFKVTIVDVGEQGTGADALVNEAVDKLTAGDQIKFDIPHRIRAVYGRQLGIAGASGGYAYIAVFYHNKRLYQIEGKAFVAGGQEEVDAMRLQQSLDLT
jgi:hypothetical protein